jgi:hypothetical protein
MENTEYKYFTESFSTDRDELPFGLRICRIKHGGKIDVTGKSVYQSLNDLINNDLKYKALLKNDYKRALLIKKRKYILLVDRIALFPKNNQFDHYSYNLLVHSMRGKISEGNFTGLHYFGIEASKNIKIVKETKTPNTLGVWEALIEVHDKEANMWIKKKKPSTFFPKAWSLTEFMFECFYAIEKMTKEPDVKNKYNSITKCGIKVAIIINQSNELKTIYPIYE